MFIELDNDITVNVNSEYNMKVNAIRYKCAWFEPIVVDSNFMVIGEYRFDRVKLFDISRLLSPDNSFSIQME